MRRHVRRIATTTSIGILALAGPLAATTVDRPSSDEPILEDLPASPGAYGVELTPDGDGVLATWIESEDDGASVRFARWSRPVDDESDDEARGWTAARTVIRGGNLFANWADRPSIRRWPDGSLVAHHLQRIASGTYAYGVRLSRSTDEGEVWTDRGWLHDDDRAVEHGFVSMHPTPKGVLAVWLDGRAMPEQTEDSHAGHGGHGHGGGGDMSLRTAFLEVGDLESEATEPKPSTLLDSRTCECCDTDVAWTSEGPIVVYRDRGEGEERDISIVRRLDGRWTEPATIHEDEWRIDGCPVNGPVVAAAGRRVVVAWFTAATSADEPTPPRVLVATSDDAGATFSTPMVVSDSTIGRVDLAMLEGGEAVVSWVDLSAFDATGGIVPVGTDPDQGTLSIRRVRRDGTLGPASAVAPMDLGRRAGFPRLAFVPGDDRTGAASSVLVAWRSEEDPGLRSIEITPPR